MGDPDEVGAEVGVEGVRDGEIELGVGGEEGESKQYGAFDAVKPVSTVMSPLWSYCSDSHDDNDSGSDIDDGNYNTMIVVMTIVMITKWKW